MVGAVLLSEGIQKFLFPGQLGAGRFVKIGLPMPEVLGPFVGTFEIVCGSLVLLDLQEKPRWQAPTRRFGARRAGGRHAPSLE